MKCRTPARTVLVVETDPAIRMLLAEVLRGEGYHVTLLTPDMVSRSSVAAADPDLLLLELLPGCADRTLELIEALQDEPANASLAILVLTTDPLLAAQHGGALRRLGCRTLLKPFDLDCFLALVSQQLIA